MTAGHAPRVLQYLVGALDTLAPPDDVTAKLERLLERLREAVTSKRAA